jgi:hypothetical protein
MCSNCWNTTKIDADDIILNNEPKLIHHQLKTPVHGFEFIIDGYSFSRLATYYKVYKCINRPEAFGMRRPSDDNKNDLFTVFVNGQAYENMIIDKYGTPNELDEINNISIEPLNVNIID